MFTKKIIKKLVKAILVSSLGQQNFYVWFEEEKIFVIK